MRRILFTVLLLAAGVAVAFLLNRRAGRAPADEADRAPSARTRQNKPPSSSIQSPTLDGGVGAQESPPEAVPVHFDLGDLDFESLQRRTPDSLYWRMAAPTDDPAVLDARARTREERNKQYGKVVSNTASVEEIHDYYAYRRKLSEDYIEVLQLILDEHGDDLSERDTGLFELTVSMHTARLAEIPDKLAEALERKAEYDRIKKEWQEQQRQNPDGQP
jgi:hypothetical protein